MKKLLILLAMSLAFSMCSKPSVCEQNNRGSIKITSTQVDPYFTYVDGTYIGIASPASFTDFDNIHAGTHQLQLINQNDNTDTWNATITIAICQEYSVSF